MITKILNKHGKSILIMVFLTMNININFSNSIICIYSGKVMAQEGSQSRYNGTDASWVDEFLEPESYKPGYYNNESTGIWNYSGDQTIMIGEVTVIAYKTKPAFIPPIVTDMFKIPTTSYVEFWSFTDEKWKAIEPKVYAPSNSQKDPPNYNEQQPITIGPGPINTKESTDTKVISHLVNWINWICNNDLDNVMMSMIVDKSVIGVKDAGYIDSGAGIVNGIEIRWQVWIVPGGFDAKGLNDNLVISATDEIFGYHRVQLKNSDTNDPRITLLFKTPTDRTAIFGKDSCIYD